jgi:hypothetical protein
VKHPLDRIVLIGFTKENKIGTENEIIDGQCKDPHNQLFYFE